MMFDDSRPTGQSLLHTREPFQDPGIRQGPLGNLEVDPT
jgi:hypothetical protein